MRVLHLSKEYFPNEGLDRQMGRKEASHGQEGTTKVRWAGDGYGKQNTDLMDCSEVLCDIATIDIVPLLYSSCFVGGGGGDTVDLPV